jgi:hypothetical protein
MNIIQELAGAYVDNATLSGDYLFSYKNTRDEVLEFYKERLNIIKADDIKMIEYADITNININDTVKLPECQWLEISTLSFVEKILIDQRRGKFIDIFPLYRFISRRIFMARR